ncbi:MAG: BrnT family toxin [Spirochaetaceae bacterium]|nr:BrnT family toxin [Spirochaetaceae bacterium]
MKKHNLDFADALPAFSDPLRKEYYDDRHSGFDEDRFLLTDFAENCLLLISFTESEPDTFRIMDLFNNPVGY